jgi:ankyrin repeat protein
MRILLIPSLLTALIFTLSGCESYAGFANAKEKCRDTGSSFHCEIARIYEEERGFVYIEEDNLIAHSIHGDVEKVKNALALGIDLDDYRNGNGDTPLALAAVYGHNETVKILLDAGADPNDINPEDDRDGRSVLHLAVRGKKSEGAIELLLDAGADPNILDKNGATPLFYPASKGKASYVKILLSRGTQPNVQLGDGTTALFVAIGGGDLDTVELLLENQADVNIKANNDLTPLHLAALLGKVKIAETLLAAGADPNALTAKEREAPYSFAYQKEKPKKMIEILEQAMLDSGTSPEQVEVLRKAAVEVKLKTFNATRQKQLQQKNRAQNENFVNQVLSILSGGN